MNEWNIKKLKQLGEWEQKKWISAPGLCELVGQMFGANETIVGLEIGVASGWTMNHFLEKLPNLSLTGIDPYNAYKDGHIKITQEMLNEQYSAALDNISDFNSRAKLIRGYSQEQVNQFEDESLDYIFIDGDHSYEAVLKDCELYFCKVKKGGIFAGHDWVLNEVRAALDKFRRDRNFPDVQHTKHDVWYWIK